LFVFFLQQQQQQQLRATAAGPVPARMENYDEEVGNEFLEEKNEFYKLKKSFKLNILKY